MKRIALVTLALLTAVVISGLMAYVIVDGLQDGPAVALLGLLGFPLGLALEHWAFSSRTRPSVPPFLGVAAVVAGIVAAGGGPVVAVAFGSFVLGVVIYALLKMLRGVPRVLPGG